MTSPIIGMLFLYSPLGGERRPRPAIGTVYPLLPGNTFVSPEWAGDTKEESCFFSGAVAPASQLWVSGRQRMDGIYTPIHI